MPSWIRARPSEHSTPFPLIGQASQVWLLSSANFPRMQSWQLPRPSTTNPIGHLVHASDPVVATHALGQDLHTENASPCEKVPTGQKLHWIVLFESANVPLLHGEHSVAPDVDEKYPGEQPTQSVEPAASDLPFAKSPGRHLLQLSAPRLEVAHPEGHVLHEIVSLSAYLPGGHRSLQASVSFVFPTPVPVFPAGQLSVHAVFSVT